MAWHIADRLLKRDPGIAFENFYSAVACGNLKEVERVLAERPQAATEKGGPKGWEPLLYLAFSRVPLAAASDNAVAIATALLDQAADPNVFFDAGDSAYTPLVGVVGEGEEERPPHPQRDALAKLFLERGTKPYDQQVVYNIHFHGNVLWYLKLMHEASLRVGQGADWDDPEWSMLNMGNYGSGARWHLEIAIKKNDLELAEWALSHGANPNASPARDRRFPQRTLYQEAVRNGLTELADLLARHGATRSVVAMEGEEAFLAACFRLDRDEALALVGRHPEYLRSPHAMFAAATRDRADVAALLLDLGTSPNIEGPPPGREYPLHTAAWNDSAAVGALLIERGAEVDYRELRFGGTALGFAYHGQRQRMIELLGRYSRDVWNLTASGQVDRLREILAAEPELAKVVHQTGETPLMRLPDDEALAIEITELFLAHGADPTIRNTHGDERFLDGLTAAECADKRGLYRVAELLRSRGG
jgi:ankyrin repeat protein